tara:strand:- start:478 stop:984 length:507 start_codon:yes stop_codon:yes gene_type:complete
LSNNNTVLVGRFGAPVGLNGKIKVIIMTTTFEVFKNLKSYTNFDGSIIWNFSNMNFTNNKCIVSLNNCSSPEEASKLKGQNIYSSKKNFPVIGKNEYYINDLIGCKTIFIKNNVIGEVTGVKNFGAGDLLEVKVNNKFVLIPFNNENNIVVNIIKKEIILDPIPGILD